jgi:nuclear transcription factor Y gamma
MSGYGGNQYLQQQQQQQYAAVPQGDMYAELLAPFWEQQIEEVSQVGRDAAEFKNHQLPLARIKKVRAASIAWRVLQLCVDLFCYTCS